MELSDEAYQALQRIAERRRKTIGEVIAEGLRLEQMLDQGDLVVRDQDKFRELAAV